MANAANLKKEIVLLANDRSISSNSNIFSTAEEFVFSFLLVTIWEIFSLNKISINNIKTIAIIAFLEISNFPFKK